MSIKALSDYTFYSRYARYDKGKKRRETWEEAVQRVFDMHRDKYADKIQEYPELGEYIDFAQKMQEKKRVLSAQRSLQFAGPAIRKHELKMYNCLFTYIDRPRVFQEIMYGLLCGCGCGISVQKQHINNLPSVELRIGPSCVYTVEDSIEGWSDAVGVLVGSYFTEPNEFSLYKGNPIVFDLTLIRPEGALIAGQFKAPGSRVFGLALEKISGVIDSRINSSGFTSDEFKGKLRPIDCYDIVMHIADTIVSGGVRRSAVISMFSVDDHEMATAKIGNWYTKNPQRGRSNNSAALLKGHTTREQFHTLIESTKEFGEPGFIWLNDLEIGFNPCSEISLVARTEDGRSGFQGCNLTEINGKWCDTEDRFIKACEASAIIGTLQAGYTDFKYLSPESKEIFEREALLGCSITGMMDNVEVLFDPEIQKRGASKIVEVNEKIAAMIGIRPAARLTAIKPAGSTSCILGTASGIHPHHAKRYIRRVQANKIDFCLHETERVNPLAVEESVWSVGKTDKVISFLCEVPAGAIVKNQLSALQLLDRVRLTQQNWVKQGTVESRCVNPKAIHNVSNTITVHPEEWDDVEKYIFDNQEWFAGISLLPSSGDLDYAQAPFSTVLTPLELVREYGDASVFASGLIVDGLHAFDNNLWHACSTAIDDSAMELSHNMADWIRRLNQFAERYFDNNLRRATYCLKHVSLWKTWCDLKREYKEVDWANVVEETEVFANVTSLAAQACSSGQCEINF